MDSGNSGSMQSSSGGDEEYDSRAESISTFLNNPLTRVGPPPEHPPPSNFLHQTHQLPAVSSSSSASMFDPLSNYFDPLSSSSSRSPPHFTNSNSLLNLDMVNWSKHLRSDTNSPDLTGFIMPSFPSVQIPRGQALGSLSGSGSASGSGLNIDQINNTGSSNSNGNGGGGGVRNPKKRSRASRRAPTTVLTTDTTNFRAMVQEFTGIPAPPFTSPFPRSRLDLFGNLSTLRSVSSPLHFDSPPHLLRPFAHKIQPPLTSASTFFSNPISSSPSMVDAINVSSTASNVNSASAANNSDHLSLFNPILNFYPLIQPSAPKFPLSANSTDSHLKMGGFGEFGLSHGGSPVNANNLSVLQHMVSSASSSDHNTSAVLRRGESNWGGGPEEGLLRSINGSSSNYNNSHHRVADHNDEVNYSASNFHLGDKGTENVAAARTEGTMESWICSSD